MVDLVIDIACIYGNGLVPGWPRKVVIPNKPSVAGAVSFFLPPRPPLVWFSMFTC